MKNKFSLTATCLLLLLTCPVQGQTPAPAATNQFKPLPRFRSGTDTNRSTVYVVGQPKGQMLMQNMTPNYIVSGGRVIPYTNMAKSAVGPQSRSQPNTLGSNPMMNPHLSLAAQKEFQNSLVAFMELKKSQPDKVSHLEMLISTADKDPSIQKKLEEIRKFVHDYVAKTSPADLPLLEIMTKPKEVMEHNGVPGNLVY